MSKFELYGKLTPNHFVNGESFDQAVFASLIEALQQAVKNAWKTPFIFVVMFGFGFLCAKGIDGFVGNVMAVLIFIMAPIAANFTMMKISKQIKSAFKTLGITQKDVNAALERVKEEEKAHTGL